MIFPWFSITINTFSNNVQQYFRRFLFCLNFYCISGGSGGVLIIPKWLIKVPETSNILSTSGLVALLTITRMLQKYKKDMGTSWNNIIFVNLGLKQIDNFRKTCMPHVPYSFWKFEYLIFILYFTRMRIGRWWISIKTFPKAWIWISYLSKNMKWKCGNFSFPGKGIPNFYFRGRESSNIK